MSGATGTGDVGYDQLAVLKLLALDGGHRGEVKVSCGDLAGRLDASNQTASRRLQALEDADYVTRDLVSDGQWVALTDAGERALEREYEDYRRIFDDPGELALAGTVTSGMGEGRHYISLPGYNRQFVEKLGYDPYPGTLNVDLDAESQRARSAMQAMGGVDIEGWEDEERTYGPATCYPCTVVAGGGDGGEHADGGDGDAGGQRTDAGGQRTDAGGQRTDAGSQDTDAGEDGEFAGAHVIVPDRTHHDESQLEVIAPEKLRDELGLLDDDEVTIRVEEQ